MVMGDSLLDDCRPLMSISTGRFESLSGASRDRPEGREEAGQDGRILYRDSDRRHGLGKREYQAGPDLAHTENLSCGT
jgi:hypothetical protein